MDIERSVRGPCQRPLLFIPPTTADKNPSFWRFVSVSTAHHIDPDRRLPIYAVIDSLQPVIEPSCPPRIHGECGVGCELCVAGKGTALSPVCPRADNQSLQAPLHFL